MQKKKKKEKRQAVGFTLIELLIVIGIIAIIVAAALPNLLNRRNTGDLKNTAAQIGALLRQAQIDSMAQNGGMSWGVHFQNATDTAPFYALFSSTSSAYSASGITGHYRLPNTVGYLNATLPLGTSLNIVFSQISGTFISFNKRRFIFSWPIVVSGDHFGRFIGRGQLVKTGKEFNFGV